MKKNVIIPAGQAFFIGLFVVMIAVSALWNKPDLRYWSFTAGAVASLFAYILLTTKWRNLKLSPSRVFHEETVKINLLDETKKPYTRGKYIETTVGREKLILLAINLDNGYNFSYSSLAGRGKLFSRSEYETLRDEFLSRGLLEWRNPEAHAQGLEITRGGWAFVRHFSRLKIPYPMSPTRKVLWDLRSSNAQAHASAHELKTDLNHA